MIHLRQKLSKKMPHFRTVRKNYKINSIVKNYTILFTIKEICLEMYILEFARL